MSLTKKQLQQQQHKREKLMKDKKNRKDQPLRSRTCIVCGGTKKVSGKDCNCCIDGMMF